jgi:alpha-tubulin suppressor-like RCC1 family protein
MEFLQKNKLLIGICLIVLFLLVINSKKNISSTPDTQKSSSQIVGLGENNTGQLGISPNDLDEGTYTISDIKKVSQIAAGRNFSLARTEDGNVYVWGGNDWGQLGLGKSESRVDGPTNNTELTHIKKIAASNNHALALSEDGHVLTFGSNFSGQLGTGDNTDSNTPVAVSGIDSVKDIAAGYKFSLALKNDGTVWGWGAKCSDAQEKISEQWWKTVIGKTEEAEDGYYDPTSDALSIHDKNEYCINEDIVGILSRTPVAIKGLSNITQISAGYGHVLALDSDGNVWSFGCNTFHQLGRITKKASDNTTPQIVKGLPKIKMVSAGYRHSLVVADDGSVWSWGLNTHGQLGTDSKDTMQITPVNVSLDNVFQIVAGYDYSLVVKKDGSVWGWGMNIEEWFADDTVKFAKTPVNVEKLKNVTQIAGGGAHILTLVQE